MHTTRKTLTTALTAGALLAALTGCGDTTTTEAGATAPETTTAPSTADPAPMPMSTTPPATTEAPAPEPSDTGDWEDQPEFADLPQEHVNAVDSAYRYLDFSSFSKAGLYDQLTSEFGDQFSPEAAQYAVDNIHADWKAEALESAKTYYEDMAMSKAAVYEQLISEYGGQFTKAEAQYAVDNLK